MPEIDLCWIDDSAEEMYLIMQHVFPSIWDEDCSCKTILFGNAYCNREIEKGPREQDRAVFEQELAHFFAVYCQTMDAYNWKENGDTFQEKKHLLPTPSVSLVPIQSEELGAPSRIAALVKNWMDRNKLNKIKDNLEVDSAENTEEPSDKAQKKTVVDNQDMSVQELIAALDIPLTATVALDICLLYGDSKRIEEGLPIISMALYAELSKAHQCYLYSGMSIARKIMDQWVETYYHFFGEEKDVKIRALKIYPKNGLTTKQAITDAKKDLIVLLDKAKGGSR